MASPFADRVIETTPTTGTGAVTLAGAVPGYRRFVEAWTVGAVVYYAIAGGAEWEVGQGTLATATTLSRDSVLASSNGGALVNFSVVAKTILADVPAASIVDAQNPQLTTGLTVTRNALGGSAHTSGLSLLNNTAAALGAQQWSPIAQFTGSQWNTTTGGSDIVDFGIQNQTVQATNSTNNKFWVGYRINNGSWVTLFTVDGTAGLVVSGAPVLSSKSNLATTSSDGLVAQNGTAATSGVPVQYSSRTRWTGAGWNTGTPISQQCDWICEVRPISGATVVNAFVFASQLAGGGYIDRLSFNSSNGGVYAGGLNTGNGFFQAQTVNSGATTDGVVITNVNAASAGTPSRWSARIRFTGFGWNTGSSASQQCDWIVENRPVSGATVSSAVVFASQINAGGYTDRVALMSDGGIEQRGDTKGTGVRRPVTHVSSSGAGVQTVATIPVATNSALAIGGRLVGIKSDNSAVYAYRIDGWALNNGGSVTAGGTATSLGASTTTTAPTITNSGTNAIIQSGDTAATNITWTFHPDTLSAVA